MMKAALVELRIDPLTVNLRGKRSHTEVLATTLRRDPDARAIAVRLAMEHALKDGAKWIVFPGWTLVAKTPPKWIVNESLGRTIVVECLSLDGPVDKHRHEPGWPAWRTYVVRDGEVRVRATQRFATAPQAVADGPQLVGDLQAGTRQDRQTTLWVCGEVELLSGGGGRRGQPGYRNPVRNETGLPDATLGRGRIVLNPAHTREGNQASRDKRAWLSRGGWTLKAANLHTGGWFFWSFDRDGNAIEEYEAAASHRSAGAWRNGSPAPARILRVEPLGERGVVGNILWVDGV